MVVDVDEKKPRRTKHLGRHPGNLIFWARPSDPWRKSGAPATATARICKSNPPARAGCNVSLSAQEYRHPHLGSVPVSEVTTADYLTVLTAIWHDKL